MIPISKRPRWVVIGANRNVPLPLRPIPTYKKPKWPPAYLSKRAPTKVNTDASTASLNSPANGGTR